MSKRNREFCEHIQTAIQTLGEEEVLKCMARSMLYMAMKNKCGLAFKCDEGQINVTLADIQLNG